MMLFSCTNSEGYGTYLASVFYDGRINVVICMYDLFPQPLSLSPLFHHTSCRVVPWFLFDIPSGVSKENKKTLYIIESKKFIYITNSLDFNNLAECDATTLSR